MLAMFSRINEEVLADAFEALVGAIYLDRGLQAASKFIIALAEVQHACIFALCHHLRQTQKSDICFCQVNCSVHGQCVWSTLLLTLVHMSHCKTIM